MDLHIGIIPDGNRRYAKLKDITLDKLYENGYLKFKELIDKINEESEKDENNILKRIKRISFYVCSRDNLTKRPQKEIKVIHSMLYKLIEDFDNADEEKKQKVKQKVKIEIVGEYKSLLPNNLVQKLVSLSKNNQKEIDIIINLAIGYDGRRQISHTFRLLRNKNLNFNDKNLKAYLGPDIDIVIRTGYQKRSSGFFPWQTIYAEWFFFDKYWPEIEKEDFINVIEKFDKIERRFGK